MIHSHWFNHLYPKGASQSLLKLGLLLRERYARNKVFPVKVALTEMGENRFTSLHIFLFLSPQLNTEICYEKISKQVSKISQDLINNLLKNESIH